MSSPARRHFQRAAAAQSAPESAIASAVRGNAYELTLAQLVEDRRRLKQVQSIERKIDAKRTMMPAYEPWVQGVLLADKGGQDAVVMTMMVWKLDIGDFDGALAIAEYAMRHKLAMPDQFKRDVPTLVAEEIADRALQLLSTGQAAPWSAVAGAYNLTAEADMPDEVKAKLMKAAGLECARLVDDGLTPDAGERGSHANAALQYLQRALALHEKVGVKKDIERIERYLKNNPSPSSAAEAGASDGQGSSSPSQSDAPPPAPGG